MTKQAVNLNKLKQEIETRKKEKNTIPSKFGENTSLGASPRDTFLNGLLESLHTGRETASSNLVKVVDTMVSERTNEPAKMRIKPVQQQTFEPQQSTVTMSPERDEQLFRDIESKRRKQTLAESIEGFSQTPTAQQRPQMNLNEGYLVENVKKVVDNYLIENFGLVVEEAIKDTILEMYAVERIKTVLQENKELIKSVVIEVIKEIQAKNKAKAQ